ncbi:YchJ family metal-binding protein [Vibrio agarivorans]|uniref:YchJ family metal-binding protein n=1 Tax=Vibrio agarivorans TaxID=153622 RepID=A0ABT7Y3W6_9VIBR|nr:YchJ family metal-binding protein [Vibrio agarivorans]MDN2482740.1 YchJ family metal-binding protein [Vibrio agarivorans]
MTTCPCKSGQAYAQCCEPVHQNHHNASIPEQLMRARYCAHVLDLVDFVVATYHPSCNAQDDYDAIADSVRSDWVNLEVTSRENGSHSDEGFVTFKAYLNQDGETLCLEERSRFVREEGLWYYIDGTFPEAAIETVKKPQPVAHDKIGRNDPCPCGSGKKFKKCCG